MYKVYVINLKSDVEKKQHMKVLCQKFNIQADFVDAIDGKKLSEQFVSDVYSGEIALNEIGRDLSRGEIGCALSHKNIYKKMIDESIEIALILEDDIDFDENLINLLDRKVNFTDNWELILLGHHTGNSRKVDTKSSFWNQKKLMYKYSLVRPCEKGYGTYGYLIKKNAAKKLLKYLKVISKPIDHYTGDSRYLNLYTINPAPIKINEFFSDNFHSMKERNHFQKKNSLFNNRTEPLKIAESLSILQLVIKLRENIKIIIKRIKPLRKYQ